MTQVSNLSGPALDWAVAKCEGTCLTKAPLSHQIKQRGCLQLMHGERYTPSNIWSQGGPIIERECITLTAKTCDREWIAHIGMNYEHDGPTPLIAAMRCYVASTLGDTINLPEELQ